MQQQLYEFSEEQNEIIRVLERRMRTVGITNIVIAAIYVVTYLLFFLRQPFALVLFLPPVALFLFVGIWTNRSASSFRKIVRTTGQDVSHLMNALVSLNRLYSLQFWAMIVLGIIVFLHVLLIGLTGLR
ncbi:MAG: hypothetical protein ABSF91_11015 [Bacteroidota bacterium]|jgi:MFS superfamily sulfate permease-like transporter